MDTRLLLVVIGTETDIVLVRKRTRRLAELIGFEGQDQTRITTAVSEIARNAYEYARGGQIEFRLAGDAPPAKLCDHRQRSRPGHRRSAGGPGRLPQVGHRAWGSACWARNG